MWTERGIKGLRTYVLTLVNTRIGLILCILGITSLIYQTLKTALFLSPAGEYLVSPATTMSIENIGSIDSLPKKKYAPIDIVYTWVNGSDPVWLAEKEKWSEVYGRKLGLNVTSGPSLNASDKNISADDRMSANRYRDSDELRYSLRSVVKYAPWARRIYLVTANQVPHWLNTAHPQLRLVSHEDIFPNKSHLPVFSSPAIEAHLHRIPGLSKHFIYFNDDVFLGSQTLPEDFVSISGKQKLIMAWDVPKCAPGCVESWLGDGYCDKACNVSACNFDFPDCFNGTNTQGGRSGSVVSIHCSKGCPDSWLGDKTCDLRCQVPECGFDAGDCGIDRVVANFPGSVIGTESITVYDPYATQQALIKPETQPLVLVVASGTPALYLNLSHLTPGLEDGLSTRNNDTGEARFVLTEVVHSESSIVHSARLLKLHSMLVIILYSGQDKAPEPPHLPHDVAIRVVGSDTVQGNNFTINFRVRIVKDASGDDVLHMPEGMGRVTGFTGMCGARRSNPWANLMLLDTPYRTLSREEEGIVVVAQRVVAPTEMEARLASDFEVRTTMFWRASPTGAVSSIPAITSSAPAGPEVSRTFTRPLCQSLVTMDATGLHQHHQGRTGKNRESRECSNLTFAEVADGRWYRVTEEDVEKHDGLMLAQAASRHTALAASHLALALQVPTAWANATQRQWFRVRLEVVSRGEGSDSSSSSTDILFCATATFAWGNVWHTKQQRQNGSGTHDHGVSMKNVSISEGEGEARHRRRRLLDTYSGSLVHVNRLYSRDFGSEARKVPAHVPHMINRVLAEEMQRRWPREWDFTSANKFRSADDMQYAFSYYHYIINRKRVMSDWGDGAEAWAGVDTRWRADRIDTFVHGGANRSYNPHNNGTDVRRFVATEIDTDGDGFVSDNEMRSLACLVSGTPPCDQALIDLRENCSSLHVDTKRTVTISDGRTHVTTSQSIPRIAAVLQCPLATSAVAQHLRDTAQTLHDVSRTGTDDVAFEMIGDNFTESLRLLDSIRARRSRFICINDNMHNPAPELEAALADFFLALYPIPSPFELPPHRRNPSLYLHELRSRMTLHV